MQIYGYTGIQNNQMPSSRKEEKIVTFATKIPMFAWIVLLFCSFIFANLFDLKMLMETYRQIFSLFEKFEGNIFFNSLVILMSGAVEIGFLFLYFYVYNSIAQRYVRVKLPYTSKEFAHNIIPFFIIANILNGLMSLTMFVEGGIYISFGILFYEMFSIMLIFFPAFFFMKKHYIKDGYGEKILLSYAVPYVIIQLVMLAFGMMI